MGGSEHRNAAVHVAPGFRPSGAQDATSTDSVSAAFWDAWNAEVRAPERLEEVSLRQRREVLRWLDAHAVAEARILEVGCGNGWLCESLLPYGEVTGTDLSRGCLERAQERLPAARFVAGDFMELEFPAGGYDIVVSLEVLSHVPDQPAFIDKLAGLLKPGGLLMLATQNGPWLRRWAEVKPTEPGQLRRWVDRNELGSLLGTAFEVKELLTVTPQAHRWPMRALTARRLRAILGPSFERLLESCGCGWTLMALARRTGAPS